MYECNALLKSVLSDQAYGLCPSSTFGSSAVIILPHKLGCSIRAIVVKWLVELCVRSVWIPMVMCLALCLWYAFFSTFFGYLVKVMSTPPLPASHILMSSRLKSDLGLKSCCPNYPEDIHFLVKQDEGALLKHFLPTVFAYLPQFSVLAVLCKQFV